MYTDTYLKLLTASELLQLIDILGFPSMAESLMNKEGSRLNHISDLNTAYRTTSESEFSFTDYCKVEQLLFTFFDLTNYQPNK